MDRVYTLNNCTASRALFVNVDPEDGVLFGVYVIEDGSIEIADCSLAFNEQIPTIPTDVSAFENDAGYVKAEDVDWLPILEKKVIVEEQTVNCNQQVYETVYSGTVVLNKAPNVYAGQNVVVTIDGVEHEVTVTNNNGTLQVGGRGWSIAFAGSILSCTMTQGEHILSIVEVKCEKLPKEFLPADIVDDALVADALEDYLAENPIEGGSIPPLVVTVENDVASHTPAEIYAHIGSGGAVYLSMNEFGFALDSFVGDSAYFTTIYERSAVSAIVKADGTVQMDLAEFALKDNIPTTEYINSLIDTKIAEIPSGGGSGDSTEWKSIYAGALSEPVSSIVIDSAADGMSLESLGVNELLVFGRLKLSGSSKLRFEHNGLWTSGNFASLGTFGDWVSYFCVHQKKFPSGIVTKISVDDKSHTLFTDVTPSGYPIKLLEIHTETADVMFTDKTFVNAYYR
jgi:hypothetical protein